MSDNGEFIVHYRFPQGGGPLLSAGFIYMLQFLFVIFDWNDKAMCYVPTVLELKTAGLCATRNNHLVSGHCSIQDLLSDLEHRYDFYWKLPQY